MSGNCRTKRIVGPYGTWDKEDLIGSHVSIASLPVSNFVGGFDNEATYTIKDIYFRISNDGKTITVIELLELPGMFFTWKDLHVRGIVVKKKEDPSDGNEEG